MVSSGTARKIPGVLADPGFDVACLAGRGGVCAAPFLALRRQDNKVLCNVSSGKEQEIQ